MSLNTFSPAVAPSPGTDSKLKPKLLVADFGDGYTQASPDGVNWLKRTVTLTWDTLLPSQADAIDAFFRAQGGYIPFYYTVSDDPLGAQRWTCVDWSQQRQSGGLRKFTAALTQYFGVLS